jgi:hypothetical protein
MTFARGNFALIWAIGAPMPTPRALAPPVTLSEPLAGA